MTGLIEKVAKTLASVTYDDLVDGGCDFFEGRDNYVNEMWKCHIDQAAAATKAIQLHARACGIIKTDEWLALHVSETELAAND